MMAETHVRILRKYSQEGGNVLAAGIELDLPETEAEQLIAKGIAEKCARFDRAIFLADLERRAEHRSQLTPDTRLAYQSDFRRFKAWCDERGEEALPATPETLCRYMLHRMFVDDVTTSTVRRNVAGISAVHAISVSGSTGGDGRLVQQAMLALGIAIRDAKISIMEGGRGSALIREDEAVRRAYEMVEGQAKVRLGQLSKPNGKANGRKS